MKKKKKETVDQPKASQPTRITTLEAFLVQLICCLGIVAAFWLAHNVFSISLLSDPSRTLRLLWMFESPIVILIYSRFRVNPGDCSFLRAAGRGILALPLGALLIALGAIALGAPVGIKYLLKTIHWSLLMSSLTFLPAASVFGFAWTHWQRILECTKISEVLDYLICIPAHGAVIGAWFGAWPMPLDWERPWQQWPICVTYGALSGYLVGMLACFGIIAARAKHVKGD